MNKIEEQINKFETIKKKIPNTDITLLTVKNDHNPLSILSYLINKKHDSSNKNSTKNIFSQSPNKQENLTEQRQKDKKKFTLVRPDEKGKSKTQQGKNHGNNNEQSNKGNANKDSDSSMGHINLLFIETHNISKSEVRKRFEKKREEEEEKTIKEKKINQEQEAGNEEKKEEKEEKVEKEEKIEKEEKEDEDKNNMSIDEDDEDKKEEPIENDVKLDNFNLNNFTHMESGINIPNNFNIFDDRLLDEEKYDKDDKDDNDQNDYNEVKNKDTYFKNKDNNEEKNNIQEENNKKEEDKEKEKEEFKMPLKVNENTNNNFKICIQLEEEGEKEKKDKKDKIDTKNNLNKKNNPEKLLQNKTKRKNSHEIKKNININKTEDNSNSQKKIPYKNKNKLILDDDDEEEFLNTNDIFPKKKEEEEKEDLIIKTEGNKIKLFLDNDDNKTTKEIDNIEINDKNNDTNKKSIQSSDKKQNNETEPSKKNKNNKTLINKNKNVLQNNSQKINNINNNYDLYCLNNIHSILIQIQEKLIKKNLEKDVVKKCSELIDNIKKNEIYINNSLKRKKDTYICVYKILRMLFNYLSEKNISENFNNEIIAILTNVEKYYKSVKINDNIINSMEFYSKRKLTFKYVFSKLELKNFEKDNLKELYINKKDNDDNSKNDVNVITDNNKAVKFIKTFKRYIKTSKEMNREIQAFKKKLSNYTQTNKIKEFLDKYEYCESYIQMSPHLMSYKKLFSHFGLILSFWMDSNNKYILAEIEQQQKKKENNNINDFKRKGKSVQVNKNGFKERRDMSMNNIKMKNIK